MARVLVLFAHPALEKSRVHRRLIQAVPDDDRLTFHDLYEAYPRLDIDVGREQELLLAHDVIVFQYPFYWYSTPPMLKQWQDLVLEHGFAYGSAGTALHGKILAQVISAGGSPAAYCREGYNHFSIRELLAPIEQTARLCGMRYLPPLVVFGTHGMGQEEIDGSSVRYEALLRGLMDDRIDEDANTRASPHTPGGAAPGLAELPTLNPVVARWAEGGSS